MKRKMSSSSSSSSSGDEIPDDLTMAEYMQMYINVSKNSKYDPEKTKRIMAEVEANRERDAKLVEEYWARKREAEARANTSRVKNKLNIQFSSS